MAGLEQIAAASSPDIAPVAWATVARVLFSIRFGGFEPAPATAQLQEALEGFKISSDNRGLSRAFLRSAWVSWAYGQAGPTAEKLLSALNHAQLAGSRGDELRTFAFLARSLLWGPTPVADALSTCEDIIEQAGDDRFVHGYVARTRAVLFAMEGRFETALAEQTSCVQIFRDLGLPIEVEEAAQSGSQVLGWSGDGSAALELLIASIANLESLKERSFQPTHRGMLARFLVEAGNLEEAETESVASRDTAERDDIMTESLWRSSLAMILVRRGDVEAADRLSLEAVTMVADSDFWVVAPAFTARADVLAALGRPEEAEEAMARAIDIFERKGATAVVQQLKAGRSTPAAAGEVV
jgi:tetratricopeptide (TPR) repeat protein